MTEMDTSYRKWWEQHTGNGGSSNRSQLAGAVTRGSDGGSGTGAVLHTGNRGSNTVWDGGSSDVSEISDRRDIQEMDIGHWTDDERIFAIK